MSLSRLEEEVVFLSEHPELPGRERFVKSCEEEVEGRHRLGSISDDERGRLLNILRGKVARNVAD